MSETTQRYEEKSKGRNISKIIVCEFLDFLKQKVENDEFTADELSSLIHSIAEGTELYATAEELGRFYGQSTHNVHCVINRRMLSKPQRRVYYPFREFKKIIPDSWHKNRR